MPGIPFNQFRNPLSAEAGFGRSFLDVRLDVLDLEREADSAAREEPGADPRLPGLNVFPQFRDALGSHSRAPRSLLTLPDGRRVPDSTWAFNQATGGRRLHDQAWAVSVSPDSLMPDDDIARRYLSPELPSLNRQRGNVFVPRGDYYIGGTIKLYSGQRLVGSSAAEGGTRLIKVGAGPCIRCLAPTTDVTDPDLASLVVDLAEWVRRNGTAVFNGLGGPPELSDLNGLAAMYREFAGRLGLTVWNPRAPQTHQRRFVEARVGVSAGDDDPRDAARRRDRRVLRLGPARASPSSGHSSARSSGARLARRSGPRSFHGSSRPSAPTTRSPRRA